MFNVIFRIHHKTKGRVDDSRQVETRDAGKAVEEATRTEIKRSLAFDYGVGESSVELVKVVRIVGKDEDQDTWQATPGDSQKVVQEDDRRTQGGVRPPQREDILAQDNRNALMGIKKTFNIDDKTIPNNLTVPELQQALIKHFYPETGPQTGTDKGGGAAKP